MENCRNQIRVVFADDNVDLTSAFCRLLEFEPDIECVSCLAHGRDVVEQVTRHAADVLVIDLSMPDCDIAAIITQLQETTPSVRTILYSGFPEGQRIDQAFAAGACSFVCKDAGPKELFRVIRAAAHGLTLAS